MKKRFISIMMALLLVAGIPVSAFADDWYLEDGSVAVTATASTSDSGETVTTQSVVQTGSDGNVFKQSDNDPNPVITQSAPTTSTQNTVTITANDGATANVTLNSVKIDVSETGDYYTAGAAAISTAGAGNVVIELDGENMLASGFLCAGLDKSTDESSTLTIKDDNGTDGSLIAKGGFDGAGIGGGKNEEGNNITIEGGTVTAKNGDGAACIGGGGVYNNASNITISGGTVIAIADGTGAGIGGFDVNNITISGGTVIAKGNCDVGIGGLIKASNITISGGTVTAIGGNTAQASAPLRETAMAVKIATLTSAELPLPAVLSQPKAVVAQRA